MGQGNGQLVDTLSQIQSDENHMASAPMMSSPDAHPCNMSSEDEPMTAEDGCCGDTCQCPEQVCSGSVYLASQLIMPADSYVDEPALPGQTSLSLTFPPSRYRPPIAA